MKFHICIHYIHASILMFMLYISHVFSPFSTTNQCIINQINGVEDIMSKLYERDGSK